MTPVSDESLKYIGKLTDLCFLRLYAEPLKGEKETMKSPPTDKGLVELTGLVKLNILVLRGDGITDAGLVHLRELKGLRDLHLAQTSTTVSGLVAFTLEHPQARVESANYEYDPISKRVSLKGAGRSDDWIEALTKLPVVRHLHCSAVDDISADGLKHLAVLASLESLRLSNCNIEDAAMVPLQHAKALKSIELWNCSSISDEGVAHLHGLELEQLKLSGTRVTAEGLEQLKRALPNCEINKPN
jgi:hypothetical protein